jgi:fermentation-respiration switch protein FrsA (DUF1100 family)
MGKIMFKTHFVFFVLMFLLLSLNVECQSTDTVVLTEGLVVKLARGNNGRIISPNAVVASIVTGKWKAPAENDEINSEDKVIGVWRKINADSTGWIKDDSLSNAYVYFRFNSDKDDIVLLEAMSHSAVYVNGLLRSGNPYADRDKYEEWAPRFDYSFIPVKFHKGINELLFECHRGALKVKIHIGKSGLIFDTTDLTTPDLFVNETSDTFGAIPIINATEDFYSNLFIKTWSEGSTPALYPVKQVIPLSILKNRFDIKLPAFQNPGKIKLNMEILKKDDSKEEVLYSSVIELRVLNRNETHKETFISNMDGSVQYYAVNPPENLKGKPALFLSLHGAGVEAINQAGSYYHKNWGYVVAPTNRRPYGYNWENWGRMDAMEVLNITKKEFDIDESRVYLTGHSMGGHGTWHVGVDYPDQFAAIGPSAGWISIWSYRINSLPDSSDVKKMLVRGTKPSDTYAFTTNLKSDGIYIIHGELDDNVPIEQAKSIVENLSKFHRDFIFYIQPGAGHWWDVSDEPGADCVDWFPMFDFFAHHSVPGKERVKTVDFTTANPAITSKNNWIQIINQTEQQKLSNINIHLEAGKRQFTGTTNNIKKFVIDASMLPIGKPVSLLLDNNLIEAVNIPADGKISLDKEHGKWKVVSGFDEANKYPARCGNFREAFNFNVMFVYGTHGSKEENKWALEKARLDAEKIWYQGNGAIEIIKDDDFDLLKYKDRSVILFGNSKTNSSWNLLLKDSPVQIDNNKIKVGNKEYNGNDFACLMIRPRVDSKFASVGVVSGSGIKGMQLVNLSPYFDQYVCLPDIVIYNSDIIQSDEKGVKFTGYFGNDWSLEKGEFVTQ